MMYVHAYIYRKARASHEIDFFKTAVYSDERDTYSVYKNKTICVYKGFNFSERGRVT